VRADPHSAAVGPNQTLQSKLAFRQDQQALAGCQAAGMASTHSERTRAPSSGRFPMASGHVRPATSLALGGPYIDPRADDLLSTTHGEISPLSRAGLEFSDTFEFDSVRHIASHRTYCDKIQLMSQLGPMQSRSSGITDGHHQTKKLRHD
jgi:hypothetical protein